ncbi:hypothetical protein MAR_033597 [Mya arenaria]|uniref:Uncharacterized protein n=1 Tax=Mya arenaria TaxID=6604 RepID=A0ABY7G9H9_MYAAR|nr:hypothetical protein MAR_033597 [Mya arenaria]
MLHHPVHWSTQKAACEALTSGRYRFIHHLSFPDGASVKNGIPRDKFAVYYNSFDNAEALTRTYPSVFSILLGILFEGSFYVDKTLSMGLSLSCYIFERFRQLLNG